MPAGSAPGERRGGRPKGSPNKRTLDIQAMLDRMKVNPLRFMARVVEGDIPCGVCFGKGRTKYKGKEGKIEERVCESCWGTTKEKISPDLKGKMAAELAQYIAPKRKAIEHSGPGGESLEVVLLQRLRAGRERARAIEQQPKE